MKYILIGLICATNACGYVSPQFEKAVEDEAIRDIQIISERVRQKTEKAQAASLQSAESATKSS